MGKVMTPCAYLVAASNLVALYALVGGGLPPHARGCRAVRIKAQALLVTQPTATGSDAAATTLQVCPAGQMHGVCFECSQSKVQAGAAHAVWSPQTDVGEGSTYHHCVQEHPRTSEVL